MLFLTNPAPFSMNLLAIIRRHLGILRWVQPPFTYPPKQKIIEHLEQEGLNAISERTFERDIKEIESYYGIRVKFCRTRGGYYLDQPEDEDVSDFNQFFQLLERCERLAFLTHAADALSTSKYLLLEDNQVNYSLPHLPVLWQALRSSRQVSFQYHAFQKEGSKQYIVTPLVLLEYRNRWYLAAWDTDDSRFKTFGLERMILPKLAKVVRQEHKRAEFLALKKDALGVFISPEDKVERVLLKVSAQMAPYICSLPLHNSQQVLQEAKGDVIVELHIIINPELESTILSLGEQVEVLEPAFLRSKFKERAKKLLELYK